MCVYVENVYLSIYLSMRVCTLLNIQTLRFRLQNKRTTVCGSPDYRRTGILQSRRTKKNKKYK